MPLFPHDHVTLLGESSLLSTGLNAGIDAANAADEEHETRVPRPVVPWVEHDIVRGWQSVANALHHFAMDCDCCPLVCRGFALWVRPRGAPHTARPRHRRARRPGTWTAAPAIAAAQAARAPRRTSPTRRALIARSASAALPPRVAGPGVCAVI